MFLEFITLLILVFIVVSTLLLARYISKNFKKDRELSRARDERMFQVFKQIERTAQTAVKTEELVIANQINLNDKMDALSSFVDERNTYVTFQQEQFKALAKTDMLAARRDELIRTKELKVALERIMGMAMTSRQEPSVIDQLAMEAVTNRIEELETILKNCGEVT